MLSPNFNVEGRKDFFVTANKLTIGSEFSFVDNIYRVTKFLTKHIVTVDQKGEKRKFYDFDFENWVTLGHIKMVSNG